MREALIERAQRGDREAFGEIAAQEIDRLYAIARLILRDPDLAGDAVQEALLRCWRQLPKLRDVSSFDGWLYRILTRTAANEAHKRRRFTANVRQLSAEPQVEDSGSGVVDRDALESGFRRLSFDQRAVIVLHHYADLPIPRVAEVLGIRPGTAKSRYHYAIAALRAALEADARLDSAEGARP